MLRRNGCHWTDLDQSRRDVSFSSRGRRREKHLQPPEQPGICMVSNIDFDSKCLSSPRSNGETESDTPRNLHTIDESTNMDIEMQESKTYFQANIVFVPKELSEFCDGHLFMKESYQDVQSLESVVAAAVFTPMVKCIVVFLPRVTSTSEVEVVWHILEGLSKVPTIHCLVIPPPPALTEYYEAVINCLSSYAENYPHFDRLEHKRRTMYSIGFTGNSLNGFHTTQEGQWSAKGLFAVKKFIHECLSITWLFKTEVKEVIATKPKVPTSVIPKKCLRSQVSKPPRAVQQKRLIPQRYFHTEPVPRSYPPPQRTMSPRCVDRVARRGDSPVRRDHRDYQRRDSHPRDDRDHQKHGSHTQHYTRSPKHRASPPRRDDRVRRRASTPSRDERPRVLPPDDQESTLSAYIKHSSKKSHHRSRSQTRRRASGPDSRTPPQYEANEARGKVRPPERSSSSSIEGVTEGIDGLATTDGDRKG